MNGTIVTYDNNSEIVITSLSCHRIKNLECSLVTSEVIQSGKEQLELLHDAILEYEEKESVLETATSLNTERKVLPTFPIVCLPNTSQVNIKSKNQHLTLVNASSCNLSSRNTTKSSSQLILSQPKTIMNQFV